MNKLILLLLVSSTISQKNFTLQNQIEHGESFIFIEGLITGTQLFENLNGSDECKLVFRPLHDDLADIIEILRNYTHDSDCIEIIRKILDKLDDSLIYINKYELPCREMGKDLIVRINKLSHKINTEMLRKSITHFLSYFGDIRDSFEFFKQKLEEKEFYIAGYTMGNLIKFIFFWDLPPF